MTPEETAKAMRKPVLTREQQEELTLAAARSLENLSAVVQPFVRAMQELAIQALPAFRAAIEPFMAKMKELQEDSDAEVREYLQAMREGRADEPQ